MAVIIKYIVVRNGEEKMTFATKREADAYDKMLDIADNLFEFLETSKIKFSENQLEDISLLLAENRDKLIPILRGMNPGTKAAKKPEQKEGENPQKKAKAKK
ncbi:MAG: YebG family protein [Proteobacteria bacterium]|nr:YebG family protein [Pseudomonadota bacterium]MBU1581956.1 YebG family protein [Pseudomonadota bacterium]MBU2453751.1 YebG family protein [Pseudomonadota bacterium]MBU2627883.1 YebG family protein [Pseudomonadota bacterium]